MIYFHFLIEDASSKALIEILMKKIRALYPDTEIVGEYKSFHGCGKLPKKTTLAKGALGDVKTGQILNDLPKFLRGLQGLASMKRAAIFVVLDADERDVQKFRNDLEALGTRSCPKVDREFCIAVKEIEAWLLGDANAVIAAYPDANKTRLRHYCDETVDGTWETLADVVYLGGGVQLHALEKKKTYRVVGEQKNDWARKIGERMSVEVGANKSPNFNEFLAAVRRRIAENSLAEGLR